MTSVSPDHGGIGLLGLPEAALQRQRVTKKMLAGQFEERSPADARLITKSVSSAWVVGMLRPATIRVPVHKDAERDVTDIPILEVSLADRTTDGTRTRVTELIHRSMARPVVVLVSVPGGNMTLSLALSRVNRTDPARSTSVIEGHVMVPTDRIEEGSLYLDRLDRTDMWALYLDLVRTAAADGRPASTALQASEAIKMRRQLSDLEIELAALIRDAKKAKNQQQRIDLNMRARTTRVRIEHTRGVLYSPDYGHDGI
ncbi:DUF4391 domain-containing protein [Nocardiopsis alba]|uniref:DUF4391 domain-containing protein n=1 Tax=Nocardiopsis alba TaxID=53437 RepID=UPI0033C54AA0